jgi:ankyrin repeat protein
MRKAPFLRVRAWLRTASIAVATGTALLPLWADNPSPTPPSALESQLLEACQNLDVPVITDLVKQGVRATACDSSGETPLMLTVNRPDIVQILLGDKPDLDLRGPDGATALYLACAANDDSSARELIAAGANPNLTVRSNLRSPLLAAIENNDPDLAVLLVQHRADPNHGFSGGTPIACAVSREQVEVTRALLEAGVPEELPKFDAAGHPQIPLVEKAALDDNTAMLDLLLAHGGSVEETDSVGGTPLLLTLLVGKADAVDYLLAKGADVNHSDTKGDSTLVTALCHQKPRVWPVSPMPGPCASCSITAPT